MLTLNIDPLKYLSKLPEFHGDQRDLQNFIDLIDKIHPLLLRYDSLAQSIFSDTIKSKLRGRAREVIEINNHVTSWIEIREILINNFGDRLTALELFDELRSTKFKTHSVDFYNEGILRRMNVRVKQDLKDDEGTIAETIKTNKNSALYIFKNKVPEPMRSLLHCRDPQSLEEAIKILHESGYAYYNGTHSTGTHAKTQNNSQSYQINLPHKNRFESRKNNSSPQFRGKQPHNEQSQYQPNKYRGFRNDYNPQFRNIQSNHEPPHFYNPNNLRNYRPQQFTQNAFSNPTNTYYRQTNPSNQTQHVQNPFSNPQPSTSKLPPPEPMEININEQLNQSQPQNFRLTASKDAYHIS